MGESFGRTLEMSRIEAQGLRRRRLADWAAFCASTGLVLLFSQFWVVLVTGPVNDVPQATSEALRNVYFPAYAVAVIMTLARPRETALALVRAPLPAVMVALAFLSIAWSFDPAVTERRAVAVMFTTLCGVAIAARHPWPEFLEVLATAFTAMALLSLALAVAVPSYGVMSHDFPGAWRGAWSHKNTLGYNMSVGFVACAGAALLSPRRRWFWALAAALALLLVVESQSATSIVSCVVAAAAMGLVAVARRGRIGLLFAVWLVAAALSAVAMVLLIDPALPLRVLGKDATLTGRTSIWTAVMRQIVQRPLTGYGYGAVWDETSRWGPLPRISQQQGFVIHEAHNSWLGIWLELGYVGLWAAALLLADVWARLILGFARRRSAFFIAPFVAIFSLHTFTETSFLVQNYLIWLMFVATSAKLAEPEDEDAPPVRLLWRR